MIDKDERIKQLTEEILKYEPKIHKYAAETIAKAWIENPEQMQKIMKEDIKLEKQGKRPEPRSFKPVYEDAIKVNAE